jgi:hypothetical protein
MQALHLQAVSWFQYIADLEDMNARRLVEVESESKVLSRIAQSAS